MTPRPRPLAAAAVRRRHPDDQTALREPSYWWLHLGFFACGVHIAFLLTHLPGEVGLGLTLLSHQVGGFFGAWLGGLAIAHFGDYGWMWRADMLLALLAALICLPIREAPVRALVDVT